MLVKSYMIMHTSASRHRFSRSRLTNNPTVHGCRFDSATAALADRLSINRCLMMGGVSVQIKKRRSFEVAIAQRAVIDEVSVSQTCERG